MITSEAQNILDEHQHEWHEIVNGEDRLGTAKFRVDIEKLARDGHVYAQLHLANHLAVGAAGYSVDLAAAKRWLSKASNSGEGRALYDLARFCEKNGTPDEAFKILYSLVESRYLPAFYRLGTYYAKGFGCRIDIAKADELRRYSAANWCVPAMRWLSGEYMKKSPRILWGLLGRMHILQVVIWAAFLFLFRRTDLRLYP